MAADTPPTDAPVRDRDSGASGAAAQQDESPIHDPRQNAGQDESIAKRLERDPACPDAVLDTALDESMDASDPPASTQPGSNSEPPKSSGFDAEAEAAIQADRQ